MKTCPFCAEEIQDAAIVCKHCRRDLSGAAPAVAPPPPKKHTVRNVLLVVGVLLAAFVATLYFGEDHQRFLVFTAQRDAWHRRCDVYVGKVPSEPVAAQAARDCQRELDALMAYAKQQGWDR